MKIHFVGVAGAGMSALAQLRALEGFQVSGSDRLADRDSLGETGVRLKNAGIALFPQDGSGISADCARVVMSTAVEQDNLDLQKAAALGVAVVHRADELAAIAGERRTIAIAGTSGKSTVTGMVFHLLEHAGLAPSLATGASVPEVRRRGLLGNAWLGSSDLLVIEADESDGTLTRYRPHLGLLLNVSKDHKPLPELMTLFETFKGRCARLAVNADAAELNSLAANTRTFGFEAGDLRGEGLVLGADDCRFAIKGVPFRLNQAGRYSAENALAAVTAAVELGVSLEECARGLETFEGVSRRFEVVGQAGGVAVFDDYAHNPEKIRAAIGAAHLRAKRVLAVFQLHGFAPARFLKDEFLDAFTAALGPRDILWLPDIYYAGGTAAKDISARDYADALRARGKDARHAPDRAALAIEAAAAAESGDLVLVMGARDPSLPELAAGVLAALKRRF